MNRRRGVKHEDGGSYFPEGKAHGGRYIKIMDTPVGYRWKAVIIVKIAEGWARTYAQAYSQALEAYKKHPWSGADNAGK